MNRILYSTVVYPCDDFDLFIKDYLTSVFNQTYQAFDLLLILDNVEPEKVETYLSEYNTGGKDVIIRKFKELTPIELRKKQIDLAYELNFDILVLSDFDENVAFNRVEEIMKNINGYAFAFNDFYIVDQNLNRISETSFFKTREIPEEVVTYKDILEFNFIGLGSMALNLNQFDYGSLNFSEEVKALDWYIATVVLLSGCRGVSLYNTYANYRQHSNSFIGFNFRLDEEKLYRGIAVKLAHYYALIEYNEVFVSLYNDIVELKKYIKDIGVNEYISLVNKKFDTNRFCWWENIKTKKELKI